MKKRHLLHRLTGRACSTHTLNRYEMSTIYAGVLIIFLIFSSCESQEEPGYSRMITDCLEQSRKEYLASGKVKFFENPLRKCLDENFVGIKMTSLVFEDKEGYLIKVDSIKKPVYIQTFSRSTGQCLRELKSLNRLVEEYQDKVEFVLLVNKDYESQERCQEVYYGNEVPDECLPFNENIRIVYFDDDNVWDLKKGYGQIILGIRNTYYPTCYYVNKDKTIFKITTIEDVLVESNKIYAQNDSISEESLSEMSFASRVPGIFKEFIDSNTN